MLNILGFVAQFRYESDRASDLQNESLKMFRELNDKPGIALSLISLGTLAQLQGENEQATASYERGLAMFRELGDKRGIAAALNNLGNLASATQNLPAARNFYEESLTLFRELDDNPEVAACLSNLAGVAQDLSDTEWATLLYRDSLSHYITVGNQVGAWKCLMRLAGIAICRTEHIRAVRLVAAAEMLYASNDIASASLTDPSREQMMASIQPLLAESKLATIWESLQSLPLARALDLALDTSDDHEQVGTQTAVAVLTPRQQEIAMLLIDGLSNRQIAEILFIAERTVDTHVEHILSRLGVRSRTQIAVWAAESGFAPRS